MPSHSDNRLELLRSNMMDTGGVEEKVEVNQRHLIDKILARYSAEYVLYRELMQNADDASSTSISIHFHSTSPDTTKPPNLQAKCDKIIFKNNGMAFRPEDWQRLKRIAEGNPDEQKIGAFGVGFYSLFSVCENPFVFSGSQCMAFYFKGDQLFAKRADVPDKDIDPWTSFLMDLREPMEMPDFDHFSRFLTTSMGFTANLKQVAIYFDDQPIFKITKREAEPRSMAVDTRKMMLTTPQRMFTITGADMRQIQLDAEKYTPPSLFAPLTNFLSSKSKLPSSSNNDGRNEKGLPVEKASIFLRVVAGALKVSVSRDFEKEMERATKKKPPSTTKFQLVYTGKEELDVSENGNQIFKDLIPFPHQGRVFIGFPTHQTTGCCCHMASRFIPTVERESIDFADRYISVWNKELLAAGGLLARMVYNDEMAQIARLYRELVGFDAEVDKIKAEEQKDNAKIMLEKRAAHALHSFTFQHSTPSTIVSKLQEEQFFASCKVPLDVMTSHGIQPITIARSVPDYTSVKGNEITKLLDGFVKTIPTITPVISEDCKDSITKLTKFNMLVPLGFNDVLKELDTRSLEEKEMVCCLKWWFKCNKNDECIPRQTKDHVINNASARQKFLEAAIMNRGEERGLLQLSHTRWFLNPKTIPADMPLPQDTMPITVSAGLPQSDMISYLGNMSELTVVHWIQFIAQSKVELETSKDFAERVLIVASKSYVHTSSTKTQADLVQILRAKRCMPTRFGMKLPQDAYFSSVKLFDDLPIVDFSKKSINDTFLTALGVRKHVELQMVFDRLISDGSWSHVDLVKYLASEATTLSDIEIKRLRETAIFTKEGEEPRLKEINKPSGVLDGEGKPIMEKQTKKVYKRYRAGDLFAPTDIVRDLNLPTIYWTRMPRWRPDSAEAKFLERLGLNIKPPLASLLLLAAPDTNTTAERVAIQRRALTYLIENRQDYNDTYNVNAIQIKFLPCSDGKTYAAPKDCYSNPNVQLLGFQVLHSDLSSVCDKLGVRENPPSDKLIAAFVDRLETNHDAARKIFEYMATRMGEFSRGQWDLLRQLAFIPVQGKQGPAQLHQPSQVYFETDTSAMTFHKELFVYVSFGSQANRFLRSCGVKDEPTTAELAALLVKDPQRYWELSGGGERYIEVLRQIAGQFNLIKSDRQLLNDMKTKPFLVGTKRTTLSEQQQQQEKLGNDEDVAEEEFVQYRLAKAADIFINNDTMAQQIFSPLSAPMEEVLEEFYINLGSKMLSSQITETYSYATHLGVTMATKKITGMIFERAPIGIYQMVNDGHKKKKDLLRDEKYIKQHLKVTQVKDLKIVRTFRHTNEKNIQPTTACADITNFQIYVSDANDIDYYDIAHSLCRLIFARTRFNDAIVMERYLTTSLYNLRRKNVPVDRILNIKKRQDAAPAYTPPTPTPPPTSTNNTHQTQRAPATPPPNMPKPLLPKELDTYTKQVKEVFGDCQDAYIRQLLSQQHTDHVQNVITRLLREDYPKVKMPGQDLEKSIVSEEEELKKQIEAAAAQQRLQAKAERSTGGFMNKILSSWRSSPSSPVAPPPSSHPPTQTTSSLIANEITKQIEESSQKPKLPKPDQTITPNFTANIQQNLKRAIHSCKPYAGQDLYSPPRINQVNESSTYCDSASGQDLTYVGNVMGMEFFVHRTVHPDDVLQQYGQPMARFNSILTALARVFELKLATIQIYYDTEGPTIAFNLSGSLFMNLRYYLALHDTTDKQQESSKRKEALIYWFMTLCHELAHNFVGQHDSTHEFYMSSFAETYLESLMNYIYGPSDHPVADPQPPTSTVAKTNPSLDLLD
ncbi:Vacuolar protein sorting-associated protein 13 [Mucor velutinosus]|uniref:Vacuolar protein sorting-associated protein 13 n=1 Tax=Mucor velutinosus TaxID=708070 RepID=A0AAN7DPI6_9FUNG|nr:Vacuolar protein sorting-associated protein 13 [Mucor velutinosus]